MQLYQRNSESNSLFEVDRIFNVSVRKDNCSHCGERRVRRDGMSFVNRPFHPAANGRISRDVLD